MEELKKLLHLRFTFKQNSNIIQFHYKLFKIISTQLAGYFCEGRNFVLNVSICFCQKDLSTVYTVNKIGIGSIFKSLFRYHDLFKIFNTVCYILPTLDNIYKASCKDKKIVQSLDGNKETVLLYTSVFNF